ncbi:MAG: endonuclease/exonuclease/phosphatase family protein [Pseudomonadota bacterium]
MWVYLRRLFLLGVAGAILVIFLGFLGRYHPALDTFAHLRLHVSAGLFVCSFVLFAYRRKIPALLTLLTSLTGFLYSFNGTPYAAKIQTADHGKPVYQLFHLNLLWLNPKKQLVIDRIREINPELISISEASNQWEPFLSQLESDWPHKAHCPEWHIRGGVTIYSKWKLDHSSDYCGVYGSFQKTFAVLEDGSKITIGSAHPRWPWPASGPEQIDTLLPELEKIGPDALIAGDFNATTWSWSLYRFATAGQLKIHAGIGGTWMFGALPEPVVQVIGFPIDNVMSKGKVNILSVETLEEMGSDHLPLLVKFQID